ncbi:MAG: trimethylamine methyltransferase family protein [Desulfobacterales bacterium]|jgi:trimethylamine--corrinoid protein Co-methyltransferase
MIHSSFTLQKSPLFSVLSEDQVFEIHRASLEVLEKTGYKIESKTAVNLLKQAGARVNGDIVKTPQHIIEECLRVAPKGFVLYDREGNRALEVEGNKSYFGSSCASPNTRDALTGEVHPTSVQDIIRGALISDALPNIDFIMPMGCPQDVPAQAADLYEFEAAVKNSRKPIIFIAYSLRGHQIVYEMAAQVAGGLDRLKERPFIIGYPEPITPLVYNQETVEKLLYTAELGMPLVSTPASNLGATTPATLAGTLALLNAESLMGLVLSQLKNPGTPYVLSCFTGIMDMSSGVCSWAAPEFSLMTAAYGDIARFYGLPNWGTAGCSDAKTLDQQAAIECTFSCLTQALSGANIIHDVGDLDHGMISSAEMLVMGDEVISMVKRFIRGIEVNADTLARGIIEKIGPGGTFLQEDHTYRHFKNELWFPTLLARQDYQTWKAEGEITMENRIRVKIRKILETHKVPPLPDQIVAVIDRLKIEGEKDLIRHTT